MEFSHVRERLTLLLIILLPFHAFLVTVLTKMIAGAGHAPLPVLALWKEVVLALMLLIAFVEIARELKIDHGKLWKIDVFDAVIALLLLLAILIAIINSPLSIINFMYGFKYDFLPLLVFLILRRVPWSERFRKLVPRCLLFIGVIVASYGIVTLFLPQTFFTWLGYSDLHSLYIPGGPIAAFQQIGGTGIRRMQSTFSGPNQLGLWLLLPWSIAFLSALTPHPTPSPPSSALRTGSRGEGVKRLVLGVLSIALLLTLSRAAWIAAAVMAMTALWLHLPRAQFRRFGLWSLVSGLCVVAAFAFIAPQVLLRTASSRNHLARPLEAIRTIAANPFGLGLGSAGPASNRTSDPCVFLDPGADVSWAEAHPALCVFVGNQQLQPTDRICHCPVLPENWYLQIGVELGILGFALYLLIVVAVLQRLRQKMENGIINYQLSIINYQLSIFLSFLGLSVAALFLHAWEDSAVAYTVWVLLAATLASAQGFRCVAEERPPVHR